MSLDNANPTVHRLAATSATAELLDPLSAANWLQSGSGSESDSDDEEPIDADEIYDLIRGITDPEHPLTLEQLAVVNPEHITVTHGPKPRVQIVFTPTVPHCSMATLIGLSIRVRMLRSLPERFKVDIKVREGSHASENAVNRQLNDKERVAAALENSHLLGVVQNCLATAGSRGMQVDR